MATSQKADLWRLVKGTPQVDPDDLAEAVEDQVARNDLDFRSRLLIRDSLGALRHYWGPRRLHEWLSQCDHEETIRSIWKEELGEPGFPSLARRMTKKTDPEEVLQYLRELGGQLHRPVQMVVAGLVALILSGHLSRATDDIDVVNEVPSEIRSQHQLLHQLESRYGLHLGHVRSRYFPAGWENRVHSLAPFGRLQVFLLDEYDVLLSKLFSDRDRDRDDLRAVMPLLEKETLVHRLTGHAQSFLAIPHLRSYAEKNWYILYGESLPS